MQTSLAVGAFVANLLPGVDEWQLNSVAGKGGDNPRISAQKGKLPILMPALRETFILRNNGKIYDELIGTRIAFSSSGASPLYQSLGFQKSKRQGLQIKPS